MELNAILIGEKSLDTLKGELKNKSLCYLTLTSLKDCLCVN